MTPAEYFTNPYLAAFRRVPPRGAGICLVCLRGARPTDAMCYSCKVTTRQVAFPAAQILPISFYEVPDQLWNVLRNYKDGRHPQVRLQLGTVLAATIGRFVNNHWSCISGLVGGEPTLVTTVPSTSGRPGLHPLVEAVRRVGILRPLYRDPLMLGGVPIQRLRATDQGFVSRDDLAGEDVLLVEDTFTSGARTQSAASALRRAGARAVGVVAVGRVIEPAHCDDCTRVWRYATAEQFQFDACSRCSQDVCSLA
ncbi:hypothetical protein [Dactylosporangium sp. NPDC051541]|uniref:hypothetical protein n=1 Tax=Dactylosporangium sp. NPDC051541 TaxID=3363977 RepID=UPI003796D521